MKVVMKAFNHETKDYCTVVESINNRGIADLVVSIIQTNYGYLVFYKEIE